VLRLATLTIALLTLTAADASAAVRPCGDIARVGERGTEIAAVGAEGVRCARARQVVVRHTLGKRTRGWSCVSAGSEGGCKRGDDSIGYARVRSRNCGNVGFERQTDNGAFGIRARGVGCRVARRVARGSRPFGPGNPGSYRETDFNCRGRHIASAKLETALYTCRMGDAIVAFQRS
jgi:hypothetical protein